LATAWLLTQRAVTAIVVGPRTQMHIGMALRAFDVQLSRADADELADLF
jgi:aryl-alcohol dehydrogenase-like predicted oxidoreductase